MLSSGDQQAIFCDIESNEPCDCGKLVTFVLRHHVVNVTYYVFQPALSIKRAILSSSLNQRIDMLHRLEEAHHVEQGACWRAGRQNANGTYRTIRSRQCCQPGRVEFGRPGALIINTVGDAPKEDVR